LLSFSSDFLRSCSACFWRIGFLLGEFGPAQSDVGLFEAVSARSRCSFSLRPRGRQPQADDQATHMKNQAQRRACCAAPIFGSYRVCWRPGLDRFVIEEALHVRRQIARRFVAAGTSFPALHDHPIQVALDHFDQFGGVGPMPFGGAGAVGLLLVAKSKDGNCGSNSLIMRRISSKRAPAGSCFQRRLRRQQLIQEHSRL